MRMQPLPTILTIAAMSLGTGVLHTQDLKVKVSVKIVLDEEGNRPQAQDGWANNDAQIRQYFDIANGVLERSGAVWRLEVDEIVDLAGVSQWYGPVEAYQARNQIERAALADPEAYAWRFDAVNLYVVNETHGALGVCSFPSGAGANHTIVSPNVWVPETEFTAEQFAFGWGVFWMHEISHYFNLCHTHGCCCDFVCLDTVLDPATQRPRGDDNIEDTLPDLDCWGAEEIAQQTFEQSYADLEPTAQEQVDRTFLNVMSYHWDDRMEHLQAYFTAGQLERMAAEMDPLRGGRRTAVLNLPQPRFSVTPDLPEATEELTLDASASSTTSGHTIDSYTWDFGDGNTDEGKVATHTYELGGVYTVRLVAGDDRELYNVSKKKLTVQQPESDTGPWQTTTVGSAEVHGGASLEADCLQVIAASGNIAGRRDEFHFTHQEVQGDFELVARIADWSAETSSSKLGLFVRESLDDNARTAGVVLHRRGSSFLHRYLQREEAGTLMRSRAGENYEEPRVWLRLRRHGDVVARSLSTDGVNWLESEIIELPELPETVYAGVASSWAVPSSGGPAAIATVCDLSLTPLEPTPSFLRGDCDQDGRACSGVSDALTLLSWLFLGRTEPPCLAACDPDGNGELELADAVYGLNFCFKGSDAPVAPFPACGVGGAVDGVLGCEESVCP